MSVANSPAARAMMALVRIGCPFLTRAAESRIHVWIVGLEPVSEGPPQHAPIRTRRAAFHHKMFGIEEIRGVAFVGRKCLKPLERPERRCGPFPAVGQESIQSKCASSAREGIDW